MRIAFDNPSSQGYPAVHAGARGAGDKYTDLNGKNVLKTPLHDFHVQHGARLVAYAGWEMPLLYTSIVEEHNQTRRSASLFDVSHMGRIEIRGKDAESLLQRVCTRQLADAAVGQSRYSHVCNAAGGILDDVIVSRYEDRWLMVCNAANRERILAWLTEHGRGRDVVIDDTTERTLMVSVQGPLAVQTLSAKLPVPIADLKRYRFLAGTYMFMNYTVFRSGYTGEDGVELILPALVGSMIGGFLAGSTEEDGWARPAGLGARDTLRLEAGMPLYGHELHENTDPLSAGLRWCVDLEKDFIGVEPLRKIAETGCRNVLMGLQLEGRRIARQHAPVMDGDTRIGEVTSGTSSPTLQQSIAMAYVETSKAQPGRRVSVDLGGKRAEAEIVKLPFYKRASG